MSTYFIINWFWGFEISTFKRLGGHIWLFWQFWRGPQNWDQCQIEWREILGVPSCNFLLHAQIWHLYGLIWYFNVKNMVTCPYFHLASTRMCLVWPIKPRPCNSVSNGCGPSSPGPPTASCHHLTSQTISNIDFVQHLSIHL